MKGDLKLNYTTTTAVTKNQTKYQSACSLKGISRNFKVLWEQNSGVPHDKVYLSKIE